MREIKFRAVNMVKYKGDDAWGLEVGKTYTLQEIANGAFIDSGHFVRS